MGVGPDGHGPVPGGSGAEVDGTEVIGKTPRTNGAMGALGQQPGDRRPADRGGAAVEQIHQPSGPR